MTATKAISILLADDSEVVRAGLKTILDLHAEASGVRLKVIGEAHSVATTLAGVATLKPDVVLLDIRLPDGSGMDACRQILASDSESKVLILTSVIDDNLIYDAMSSGAHGYLLKEINAQGLCQAIQDVAGGKFILDPTLTTRLLHLVRSNSLSATEQNPLSILSSQERRVLSLVAEGKTNKEIAEQMSLSDKTVKNYLSNVFEKLKISRRSQAAVLYLEHRGHGDNRP
jgi:two-component system response regulator DevR